MQQDLPSDSSGQAAPASPQLDPSMSLDAQMDLLESSEQQRAKSNEGAHTAVNQDPLALLTDLSSIPGMSELSTSTEQPTAGGDDATSGAWASEFLNIEPSANSTNDESASINGVAKAAVSTSSPYADEGGEPEVNGTAAGTAGNDHAYSPPSPDMDVESSQSQTQPPEDQALLDAAQAAQSAVASAVVDSQPTSAQAFTPRPSPLPVKPITSSPAPAGDAARQLARKPRPTTRLAQLKQRVEEDPMDGQAWLDLINDATNKGDLDRTRETYDSFLTLFPDASRQWIAYADLELSHDNFDRVEAIFKTCLMRSTSIDLWRFYITYLRRRNPIDTSNPDRARETRGVIQRAFEFSLQHIGIDREAGSIWRDYISFLREAEGRAAYEAQQINDVLRRTFQRAVVIPLNVVEELWADYNAWENAMNKMTARKFVGEKSAAYTSSRLAMRVMRPMLDGLDNFHGVPPRPNWARQSDHDIVDGWKRYLAWEEDNPLQLDDVTALQQRITYAYRKAIAELRFYPEIWFSAAAYAKSIGKADDSIAFLKSGMTANPTSLLLHFAFAEAEESKRSFVETHATYDSLSNRLQAQLDRLNAETEQAAVEAADLAKAAWSNAGPSRMDEDGVESTQSDAVAAARQKVVDGAAPRVTSIKNALASVWIAQMRFARRSEGKKPARDVFSRARKTGVVWQVFEAAAMIEYHLNKEPKVASNVFELGLKQFDKDIDFVLRYLDFLINTNDDANARAVFERTITGFDTLAARKLWDRWARYESEFGDLAAIQKLDERIAEAYPGAKAVYRFAERNTYLGLTELVKRDFGIGVPIETPAGRRRSRSFSPDPVRRKRSPSPIPPPRAYRDRERDISPPNKRGRFGPGRPPRSPSPPPRRMPLPPQGGPPPRRGMSPPRRHSPGPPPRFDDFDEPLPEAIAFFMRILPSAHSFEGPSLDGSAVANVIASAQALVPARIGPPGGGGRPFGEPARGASPPRRWGPKPGPPPRQPPLTYGQGRY